jgi:hypothetical protein
VIKNEDVTFVIQGSISDNATLHSTNKLIRSLKRFYPGSDLIVSTFQSLKLEKVECNNFVISNDPGSQKSNILTGAMNNVNRQITASREGLIQVNTKYSVKLRNDLIFKNNHLLKVLNARPPKAISSYSLTKEYVIICNFTTVNPSKFLKLPHHPCDWLYAGLTSDILSIWDIKHFSDEDAHYYEKPEFHKVSIHQRGDINRFRPEAFIWKSFLEKSVKLDFEDSYDLSSDNIRITNQYFANNLVILTPRILGFKSQKHKQKLKSKSKMYSLRDYKNLIDHYGITMNYPKFDLDSIIIDIYRYIFNYFGRFLKNKNVSIRY